MTEDRSRGSSRRALLRGLPVALVGLLAAIARPGGAPAYAKTTAPTAPYDPLTQVWRCTYNECEPYFYHPEKGDPENIVGSHPIPPGTAFEDLPDSWLCPVCGAPKRWFIKEG
ncbi:rubredoxin [Roseospira marina]|uniref:Rubredoxin n=1 Tax=Roseospira marina TaxID=140057 RepID=A0A5M6ID69_9PROT|nr:rubredoxin [Roseospira marina]KAA5605685.1 rubredoxin [Roseospira marina]MBB4313233.1 rubredoxin [Roseospira marina]MBB5086026.1 rubredoxin [Roseospira marina]